MGKMKEKQVELQIALDTIDELGGLMVYVLTLNGTPCNAYLDKADADYEAWLCREADSCNEDGEVNVYAVTEVCLLTH